MRGNKLRKLLVPAAVAAAMTLTPPAWADAGDAPGRAAASRGLTTGKVNVQDLSVGNGVPTETISSNLAQAGDPETPGVTAGGDSTA